MMKQVRLSGDLSVRVEGLAASERRSFANMVEVLLLAALAERDHGVKGSGGGLTPAGPSVPLGGESTGASASPAPSVARSASAVPSDVQTSVIVRPHMKKHRPAVECPTRIEVGVCPDCGTVVT